MVLNKYDEVEKEAIECRLFSIKPHFVDLILKGKKKVELRKGFCNGKRGDKCFIYVTSPIKQIIGYFTIAYCINDTTANIWKRVNGIAGVNKQGFFEYYANNKEASAIFFDKLIFFKQPLDWEKLNERFKLMPPQSYYQIRGDLADYLERQRCI